MEIRKPKEGRIVIRRNISSMRRNSPGWVGKATIDGVTYKVLMYDQPPVRMSGYIKVIGPRHITERERKEIERKEKLKAKQEYKQEDVKGKDSPF